MSPAIYEYPRTRFDPEGLEVLRFQVGRRDGPRWWGHVKRGAREGEERRTRKRGISTNAINAHDNISNNKYQDVNPLAKVTSGINQRPWALRCEPSVHIRSSVCTLVESHRKLVKLNSRNSINYRDNTIVVSMSVARARVRKIKEIREGREGDGKNDTSAFQQSVKVILTVLRKFSLPKLIEFDFFKR